uniref:Uncharacterized protein n=1 Tax=Vitis vinifera TaxID=29760 RepID=A5AM13_VITVI|nr:hypothetical protein VITISV_015199 [Vitis vinifera]
MIKQPGILSKAVKKLMEWLERIDEFRNPTSVAGYSIPKGSHVLLSRLGLGRNPRIWEEPLNFNPERHLNARMLARLLQGFTWSPPPGQKEIDFSESRNDLSLLQNLCMP